MNIESITGIVNRVDVRYVDVTRHVRCFAWVNVSPENQFQVITDDPRLQSALEMAAILKAQTEIGFEQSEPEGERVVVQVRVTEVPQEVEDLYGLALPCGSLPKHRFIPVFFCGFRLSIRSDLG